MTSARARQLAKQVIENDPGKALPLLILLSAFKTSHGTPSDDAMTDEVMLYLYSLSDHCRDSMKALISQSEVDQKAA